MSYPDEAAEQRNVHQRRSATTLRISVIRNGYLVTYGDTGEAESASDREALHHMVDEFFDRVEADPGPKPLSNRSRGAVAASVPILAPMRRPGRSI